MPLKKFWVYILHCENNSFYTGFTVDIEKRYRAHLEGSGHCKYTRSFKPLSLVRCWQINGNKALAMKVERYIKKLSRAEKENLIAHPDILSQQFPVKQCQ